MRLIFTACFVALCAGCNAADTAPTKPAPSPATSAPPATVVAAVTALSFTPTGQSGQFDLENTGAEMSLRSRLQVEKRVGGEWRPVASEIYVADACIAADPPACRTLKSREKIRLLRYEGFTCNMACPPGCMANVQLSPGSFRLVAQSCDGAQRFSSAEFDLK